MIIFFANLFLNVILKDKENWLGGVKLFFSTSIVKDKEIIFSMSKIINNAF